MAGDSVAVTPSKRTLSTRRTYDIEELLKLAIGDVNVELHPYEISVDVADKIRYWLGRAFDAGAHAARTVDPPR